MNTTTEKSTQELMSSFMIALESLERDYEPDENLDNHEDGNFTPDGYSDVDLLEIQAMSDEDVQRELLEFGHDESSIALSLGLLKGKKESSDEDNVVVFPDPRIKQRRIEAKLQSTLIATLIQQALLTKASLTEDKVGTDYSQKVVDSYTNQSQEGIGELIPISPANDDSELAKSISDTERKLTFYKRAFGVAASLFLLVSVIAIAPTIVGKKTETIAALEVPDQVVIPDYQNTESSFGGHNQPIATPAVHRTPNPPKAVPVTRLDYVEAMDVIDQINSGDIEANAVQKLRMAQRLSEAARAEVLQVKKEGLAYQESNTCAAIGTYERAVISGDTLSKIIEGCAYGIRDSRFFETNQVINVGDILIFEVDSSRMITGVDIERYNEPRTTLYKHDG